MEPFWLAAGDVRETAGLNGPVYSKTRALRTSLMPDVNGP